MPQPTQMASIAAWDDETHVVQNRELYRQKFAAVVPILREVMEVDAPEAAFYLWPRVGDGERFTRELFERHNVTVLPAATSRGTCLAEIPVMNACAFRWSRPFPSASKRRIAFTTS